MGKNYHSGKPAGAPRKEIDLIAVERAAGIGCQNDEIAAILGISKQTLYTHIGHTPAVQEAIDRGRAKGRGTLRRLQWQRAQGGSDTMCIWLGKQMLGQRDRHELGGEDGGPIVMRMIVTGVRRAIEDETPDDETD